MAMKPYINNFALAKLNVSKRYSCLEIVPRVLHVPLPAEYLSNINKAMMTLLQDELEIYCPSLQGVPVAFNKQSVKLVEKYGSLIAAQPYIHCNVQCEFVVFKPEVKDLLLGVVNKCTDSVIGCLIHDCFFATIHRRTKKNVDERHVKLGDEILIRVTKLEEDGNGVLSIIAAFQRSFKSSNTIEDVDSVRKDKGEELHEDEVVSSRGADSGIENADHDTDSIGCRVQDAVAAQLSDSSSANSDTELASDSILASIGSKSLLEFKKPTSMKSHGKQKEENAAEIPAIENGDNNATAPSKKRKKEKKKEKKHKKHRKAKKEKHKSKKSGREDKVEKGSSSSDREHSQSIISNAEQNRSVVQEADQESKSIIIHEAETVLPLPHIKDFMPSSDHSDELTVNCVKERKKRKRKSNVLGDAKKSAKKSKRSGDCSSIHLSPSAANIVPDVGSNGDSKPEGFQSPPSVQLEEHQRQALYHLQQLGINLPLSALTLPSETQPPTQTSVVPDMVQFPSPISGEKSVGKKRKKAPKKDKDTKTMTSFMTSTPFPVQQESSAFSFKHEIKSDSPSVIQRGHESIGHSKQSEKKKKKKSKTRVESLEYKKPVHVKSEDVSMTSIVESQSGTDQVPSIAMKPKRKTHKKSKTHSKKHQNS